MRLSARSAGYTRSGQTVSGSTSSPSPEQSRAKSRDKLKLSALERKILNCIQENILLEPQPFKILSKRIGIKEEVLLQTIKQLKNRGFIRSFSAGINHKRLGFISSLIALKVPLSKIETIAKRIVKYPEVTHCYQRQGEFNLWVVFLCLKKEKLKQFLNKLSKQVGRENILNLPTQRQFKLKTRLKI